MPLAAEPCLQRELHLALTGGEQGLAFQDLAGCQPTSLGQTSLKREHRMPETVSTPCKTLWSEVLRQYDLSSERQLPG